MRRLESLMFIDLLSLAVNDGFCRVRALRSSIAKLWSEAGPTPLKLRRATSPLSTDMTLVFGSAVHFEAPLRSFVAK